MDLRIEGRTALVMGASKGIGLAIAAALAGEGVRVAAAKEIEGDTTAFQADTDELDRLAALPDEVASRVGPVEILITNTGGPPLGGALDHEREVWEEAYRSLVLAPLVLADAVLPGMRERKWGRIVNVGSSSVREPIPHLTLSNANRMAAIGLFKTLATEIASDGITVNTVATGRFATDRLAENWGSWEEMQAKAPEGIPAGRLGQPEEFGDLVAFICSERAAYLTGTVVPLDGGMLRSV